MKNTKQGFISQQKEKYIPYDTSIDSQLWDNIQLNHLLEQLGLVRIKKEKEIIFNNIDQIITFTMLKGEQKYKSRPKIIA